MPEQAFISSENVPNVFSQQCDTGEGKSLCLQWVGAGWAAQLDREGGPVGGWAFQPLNCGTLHKGMSHKPSIANPGTSKIPCLYKSLWGWLKPLLSFSRTFGSACAPSWERARLCATTAAKPRAPFSSARSTPGSPCDYIVVLDKALLLPVAGPSLPWVWFVSAPWKSSPQWASLLLSLTHFPCFPPCKIVGYV